MNEGPKKGRKKHTHHYNVGLHSVYGTSSMIIWADMMPVDA